MPETTQTPAEVAAEVNAMSRSELVRTHHLFDYAHTLHLLGMDPDELNDGHPSRALEHWTPEEVRAVVTLFQTWPEDKAFTDRLGAFETHVAQSFAAALKKESIPPNRQQKLRIAATCFSEACREVLGFKDFKDINIVFAPYASSFTYGGAAPNGDLQICSRNILKPRVAGSQFDGDLSFIELVLHESTHLLQLYMAEKTDYETPDQFANMMAARNSYEATKGMRKLSKDLDNDPNWQHPFERQARSIAGHITQQVQTLTPGLEKS